MLAAVETLIPVFAIILLGALLKRLGLLNEDQWRGVEDLIYYVCFPALIVATIARADFTSVPVFALSAAMAGAVLAMAAILFALRDPIQRLVNADRPAFTSIFQGSTRWNTYIALAIVGSLYGTQGISLAAIAIAVMIPLLNVMCVALLLVYLRDETPDPRVIAHGIYTNPLIVACIVGIAINMSGIRIYGPVLEGGDILGRATLGLGLICVGRGAAARGRAAHRPPRRLHRGDAPCGNAGADGRLLPRLRRARGPAGRRHHLRRGPHRLVLLCAGAQARRRRAAHGAYPDHPDHRRRADAAADDMAVADNVRITALRGLRRSR